MLKPFVKHLFIRINKPKKILEQTSFPTEEPLYEVQILDTHSGMDMINIPELKKAWNLYSQKKLKFWQFDFIVFSHIPKWMVRYCNHAWMVGARYCKYEFEFMLVPWNNLTVPPNYKAFG